MSKYDVFFKVKPPHRTTEKAYGFWSNSDDPRDLVWVPKSHCYLDRHAGVDVLFVADWLEARNKLSERIAAP